MGGNSTVEYLGIQLYSNILGYCSNFALSLTVLTAAAQSFLVLVACLQMPFLYLHWDRAAGPLKSPFFLLGKFT